MPVNIYELGLIYGVDVDERGNARIRMTLTAPNCPVAGTLPAEVERAVRAVAGVTDVKDRTDVRSALVEGPHVGSRQTGVGHRRSHSHCEAAPMKLSANEEYGVRCLVRLGYATEAGGALTIPEISQAEGVSPAYAAKILRVLRKGGFVKAARGKEGGYKLARPAGTIVIGARHRRAGRAAVRKRFLRQSLRPGGHLHAFGGLLGALAVARGAGGGGPGAQQSHACATCCRTNSWVRRDELLGADHSDREPSVPGYPICGVHAET
jgi:hypothetical protein